jgi:hypothetical protein
VQRFCNGFFYYMGKQGACPFLKAIIIGQWFEANDHNEVRAANQSYYPRHCFIKGYQTDLLNRKTAVAVPVPAYRNPEVEPECDLLDFDPMGVWVGAMAGRSRSF